VSLLISDVPGDDPVDVASGPTVPDPTTCADALAILERYGVDAAPAILRLLRSGAGESVKPGAARLARAEAQLVMTPRLALDAAAAVAREAGVAVHVLGDDGKDDIAGALMGPDTIERAWRAGLQPAASLANNDAHTFFGALGDAVVTGPTLTNVNDFRAIFVGRAERGSAPEAS
jgi:glycerate-2-kinase